MPTINSDMVSQVAQFLKNLPLGKKVGLLSVAAISVVCFIGVMLWTEKIDFQVLYSNLTPDDANSIIEKLKEKKTPYQISSNGTSISIPAKIIYETRLEMASKGLPQGSGVGFEIFDGKTLGMTDFIQNVNYQRAIQGELSRTINGLSEVESSRVHIVMPKESLFVEEQEPVTASVALKLRSNRILSNDQIQGIVHLISSSISGLSPDNVTIIDNNGKMLAGFKEKNSFGEFSSDQLEYQKKVEDSFEKRVKTMLETALGVEKAIVRVSCALDFKKLEKTEERYDPETKVVRSEQTLNEHSNSGSPVAQGVPGVASNLKEGTAVATSATGTINSGYQKEDKTINYEITKVTSHTIEPVGQVNKISVAVLVDGNYKKIENENGEEELKYFPRTSEEIEKFKNIVKRAVNFDQNRGDEVEVLNIPFEGTTLSKTNAAKEEGKSTMWSSIADYARAGIKYGFVAAFIMLFFIFIARPLVQWLTSGQNVGPEILTQLPKTVEELEREYLGGTKGPTSRDRALDVIKRDKDLSVQLMKDWLKKT